MCVTGGRTCWPSLSLGGADLVPPRRGPVLQRDGLDAVARAVLEDVPGRGGRGTARIAVWAGVDFDTVLR